jgi:plastocyanin
MCALKLSRIFSSASRLVLVTVLSCAPAAATATPSPTPTAAATATPSPTPTAVAESYSTVESSVQPPGSILVELMNFAFKPADIPLPAGKVVLYLVNTSSAVHSMALLNPAVSISAVVALSKNVRAGHTAIFTIDNLPRGVYRVTCPIDDHSGYGMIGTITAQ